MQRDVSEDKINWSLVADGPLLKRYAIHLTNGAKKYEARNWLKAEGQEELDRFRESAFRHFLQFMVGDVDEDHAAAVVFNINGILYIQEKLKKKKSIEWAAGLFEGEGSIVVRPERHSIQLTVYNTDEDTVKNFADAVGLGSVKGPRKVVRRGEGQVPAGEYKDMWEWHAYSTNARKVLELLLPHLGNRRTAKAKEALSIKSQRPSNKTETKEG